jgi:hypothetical protein
LHKQQDQQAAGNADAQTGNIDKGKTFLIFYVTKSNDQIITPHTSKFPILDTGKQYSRFE